MHGQRRKRWTNIDPTLGERLLFAGIEGFSLCSDVFLSQLKPSELYIISFDKGFGLGLNLFKSFSAQTNTIGFVHRLHVNWDI